MFEGPEVQIEHLTRDEMWEIIRTLRIISHWGKIM